MSPPSQRLPSVRFAVLLGSVVAVTLVGSAALAPAASAALEARLPGEAPPFSRVFDRLAIAILLVNLVVFHRAFALERIAELWQAEGWAERGRRAVVGLAASLVPALLVLAPAIESSDLLWAGRTALEAAQRMVSAIPGAVVVGVAEESFFRVVVFGGLAATWRWPLAAAVASVLYSVVHFLAPLGGYAVGGASPVEGLRYLGVVVGRAVDPATLPAVLGLFLVGMVLCLALQRARSLGFVIGLHAGWLLAAKAAIRVTALPEALVDGGSHAKRQLLMGSPWLWLAIVVTAVVVVVATRPKSAETGRVRP